MSEHTTTYDFVSDSFGHASTLIGTFEDHCIDVMTGKPLLSKHSDTFTRAIKILAEKRKQLSVEYEKKNRGEPFDYFFIYGHTPEGWNGETYEKLGPRLWKKVERSKV